MNAGLGGRRPQEKAQENNGARLVQRLVIVAALGGLHAAGAARGAGAALDDVERGGQPLAPGPVAALGEAGAPGMPIVDENSCLLYTSDAADEL